jgi:hypothetical protein
MHRMRGAPLPLKAINEAKAEMERVVNVNYPTTELRIPDSTYSSFRLSF